MICGLFFLQQIVDPYYSRIRNEAYKLLKLCEEGFELTRDERDCSVYTGTGGKVTLDLPTCRSFQSPNFIDAYVQQLVVGSNPSQSLKTFSGLFFQKCYGYIHIYHHVYSVYLL